MIIIGLKAENFKRIKAVSLKPQSGINKVSGKNEQGKTSLFDAIRAAFRSGRELDKMPVRTGADKAVIELDMGEIIVKRTITDKSNTVTIESKEEGRIKQPQELLNRLYGEIAFDLMRFIKMKGAEQYSLLKDCLGVGDQIETLEAEHQQKYDLRTVANRDVKTAEQKMSGYTVDDMVGYERVEMTAIVEELELANKQKADIDEYARLIEDDKQAIVNYEKIIEDKEHDIKIMQEHIEKAKGYISEAKTSIVNKEPFVNVEIIDPQPIRDKMARIEETNRTVDQNLRHREQQEELTGFKDTAKTLDADMTGITEQIKTIMEGLEMPIPGLTMAGGEVFYKDIPVDQVSASEKLKVSMAIAMALNPELKVILITDASLLDSDSMAEIERIAEENGFQIWLELVDNTGKVGIVIEDGMVKPNAEAAT